MSRYGRDPRHDRRKVKEAINRLIEHRRVTYRKRGKTPAARPGIVGRLGASVRITRDTPD